MEKELNILRENPYKKNSDELIKSKLKDNLSTEEKDLFDSIILSIISAYYTLEIKLDEEISVKLLFENPINLDLSITIALAAKNAIGKSSLKLIKRIINENEMVSGFNLIYTDQGIEV